MKTYKQRLEQSQEENINLLNELKRLRIEYNTLLKKTLEGISIESTDSRQWKYIIDILNDIRANGGAYSSAKAVELLYVLGELK